MSKYILCQVDFVDFDAVQSQTLAAVDGKVAAEVPAVPNRPK